MNTSTVSFEISATGPDLVLTACLDDVVIYQGCPCEAVQKISHDFNDSAIAQHVLRFELSGKQPEHTLISPDGEIVRDCVVRIENLAMDDIELGHVVSQVARYSHDTNGTTAPKSEAFYGTMGCNGRVEMHFSSPIYLWLLENM